MNRLCSLVLVSTVALLSASILSAGTLTVMTAGPLGSFAINTSIANNDGFDLLEVIFDLSGTTTSTGEQLVIDDSGVFGVNPPAGGTATYFQADPLGGGFSTFGFNFTSFNDGDSFLFSWDPDVPSNNDYSAVVSETAGIKVTLGTSGGAVTGVMQIVDSNVIATVTSPIPEPTSLVLLGSGLLALALVSRHSWSKR